MICVVLTPATVTELADEHRRAIEAGARLVEWRLDFLTEPFDVKQLLAERAGPVIVTVRLPADGGRWKGNEEQRRQILKEAIAAGAEYVDLEEPTARAISRSGKTNRVGSCHDFDSTPDDLQAIHDRLVAADADVVKLATMARSTHDAFRMLELVRASSVPTVGLCMGELGMPTRVLSPALGSPFTYAIPDGREPPAAGLLTFTTMRDLYRCESTNRETAIYGVIGDPIGHSKSPLIYNAAFAEHGINAVYVPFRVPSAELLGFLDDARALGIRGLSVTIPHKEAILATATEIDPMAAAIGAANTIRFDRDSTKVWNTDCAAAVESLATALDQPADSPNFAERTCLVLGAGGAAKAIVYGLKQAGASVAIASRSRERAEELAGPWECEVVDWAARSTVRVDVLVNCTPLGMHPNVAATPMDVAYFRRGMVVFDTVYTPERTRLLQDAEAAGCKIVTGIEMFIRQARRQFDLLVGAGEWRQGTGELWRALLRPRLPTPDSRPLILIGYRGSGKSAVAACLARRLNLRAIDADVELERRAGKTIAEIFATEGEQAFRDWESRVLADVILDKASVIAAGGGVVMREENRAQLAKAGAVVWLRASVETILARVAADPTTAARRPNLTTAGGEAEVRKLLATREPLYRQCATFAIDTDTLDPDAIAAEILNRLSTLSS